MYGSDNDVYNGSKTLALRIVQESVIFFLPLSLPLLSKARTMVVETSDKPVQRNKLRLSDFNLTLICSLALLSLSSFNYGLSNQAFASTQATNAFTRQFGEYKSGKNKYVLPALYLSLLNSIKAGTQLCGMFMLLRRSWEPSQISQIYRILTLRYQASLSVAGLANAMVDDGAFF